MKPDEAGRLLQKIAKRGRPKTQSRPQNFLPDICRQEEDVSRYEYSHQVFDKTGDVVACCLAFYTIDERINEFTSRHTNVMDAKVIYRKQKESFFI